MVLSCNHLCNQTHKVAVGCHGNTCDCDLITLYCLASMLSMYRKVFLNGSWFFSNWQALFSFDFEKEWKGRSFEIKHMGTLDIYTLWDLALEGSANGALDPFFKVSV